jgi:hypothetical protein
VDKPLNAALCLMSEQDSYASGILYYFSDLSDLSKLLSNAGVPNNMGQWAIRLKQFDCKVAYVGNVSPKEPYEIEIDGYGVEIDIIAGQCEELSQVFINNNIGFEMAHFDTDGNEINEYNFKPK